MKFLPRKRSKKAVGKERRKRTVKMDEDDEGKWNKRSKRKVFEWLFRTVDLASSKDEENEKKKR